MKLVITGHRPSKLGGYNNKKVHNRIIKAIEETILLLKPDILITGMAIGVDQWAAEICRKHKIPYVAAVPFKHQYLKWPTVACEKYFALLRRAVEVVYVDRQEGYISTNAAPDIYHVEKLTTRNKWMVDQLVPEDRLLAVTTLRGRYSSGSAHTINYCSSLRPGVNIHYITCDEYLGNSARERDKDPLDNLPF
jgi:uncharacterized phage-like protein YoqJ